MSDPRAFRPLIIAAHVVLLLAGCAHEAQRGNDGVALRALPVPASPRPAPAAARRTPPEPMSAPARIRSPASPAAMPSNTPPQRAAAPVAPTVAPHNPPVAIVPPMLPRAEAPVDPDAVTRLTQAQAAPPSPVLRPSEVERPGLVGRPDPISRLSTRPDREQPAGTPPPKPAAPKAPAEVKLAPPPAVPEAPKLPEKRVEPPTPKGQPAPAAVEPPKVLPSVPKAELPPPFGLPPTPPVVQPKSLPADRPTADARRQGTPATPPAASPKATEKTAPVDGTAAAIDQANLLLRIGNVQGARELLQPGFRARHAETIAELGRTFDPIELEGLLVPPGTADAARAIELYAEAVRLGSSSARSRLDRIKAKPAPATLPQKK